MGVFVYDIERARMNTHGREIYKIFQIISEEFTPFGRNKLRRKYKGATYDTKLENELFDSKNLAQDISQ